MQACNFFLRSIFLLFSILLLLIVSFPSPFLLQPWFTLQITNAQQPITTNDLVTYQRHNNFIKEFVTPFTDRGLKGIVTDPQGNAWFYHSTYNTSTVVKLNPSTMNYTKYNVEGKTVVDNAIVNLAGGQLVFDHGRNTVWFTDARTNSIGKLDIKSGGKIQLISIPTSKSGPMGITLSPDDNAIWFAEITGNKIASLDIQSNKIVEYPIVVSGNGIPGTSEDNGPTFLAFDSRGVLWVTLSYSGSVLRVEPWALVPNVSSMGMSSYTFIPKSETFSPFGVAVIDHNVGTEQPQQQMFVSDHGSSRVISSDVDPNLLLQSYVSYWTSPSSIYPTTLPGQIVADKNEKNIYFPEHGGDRIAKIDVDSGIMTEYDIPTGPLATSLFIALSEDGKRVWFTEWASNKVAYLDTTIPIAISMQVSKNYNSNNNSTNTVLILRHNEPRTIDTILRTVAVVNSSTPAPIQKYLALNNVTISLVGMSDSGITGIAYTAQPQQIDMHKNSIARSEIAIDIGNGNVGMARPGQYTAMVRASAPENIDNNLHVSILYPIQIRLDVPAGQSSSSLQLSQQQEQQPTQYLNSNNIGTNSQSLGVLFDFTTLGGLLRVLALVSAIALIAFVVFRRAKRRRNIGQKKHEV